MVEKNLSLGRLSQHHILIMGNGLFKRAAASLLINTGARNYHIIVIVAVACAEYL